MPPVLATPPSSADRSAAARWRIMMRSAPVLVCELDPSGHIVEASQAWLHLSGMSADELQGRSPLDFLTPQSARDLQRFCGPQGSMPSLRDHPCEWTHPDGQELSLRLNTLAWRDERGRADGSLWVFRDVTQTSRLSAQLEQASRCDPLTGAWTRSWFTEQFRLALNLAQRESLPLCLLLIQIEHFRELNDRWGHAAGDAALCSVMATLRRGLRADDGVGRLGGASFAVLLAGLDLAAAHPTVERLRSSISDLEITHGGSTRRLQARYSLAELESGDTPENALRRAERAVAGPRPGQASRQADQRL